MAGPTSETKMVLELGYRCRIVISSEAAFSIMQILAKENILLCDDKYDGSKRIDTLKPWGSDEVKVSIISHAQILARTAAGETS